MFSLPRTNASSKVALQTSAKELSKISDSIPGLSLPPGIASAACTRRAKINGAPKGNISSPLGGPIEAAKVGRAEGGREDEGLVSKREKGARGRERVGQITEPGAVPPSRVD